MYCKCLNPTHRVANKLVSLSLSIYMVYLRLYNYICVDHILTISVMAIIMSQDNIYMFFYLRLCNFIFIYLTLNIHIYFNYGAIWNSAHVPCLVDINAR